MSSSTVRIRVSLRWWFTPYLWGLLTAAYLTGRAPDRDKVERMVQRAVVLRLEPGIEA